MASTTIAEISRLDVEDLELPVLASITDIQPLSSYNWIEAPHGTPTIAVPGSPARWSVPQVSRQLQRDSGLTYIAQNAARHPDSPLEALFRATYITCPSFDVRSIDVVTDRNNIRKLLSFVDPTTTRNGIEAFTINIEIVQNTAIFCRDEAKTMEYIGPQDFRGYGHEFERAHTVSQIRGSTGHHRIISYRFGDLNFIVRHETDGYVGPDTRTLPPKPRDHAEDSISDLFGTLSLSSSIKIPGVTPGSKLVVKEEGEEVSLESTLEIKTRTLHKPLDFSDVAPQLWISQTPKLVRAYHQNGTFQRPVVEDVAAAIKSWEGQKQNELRKLAALIQRIINLVKRCGSNAVLKYNMEGDKLVICKAEKKHMLPADLYLKWDGERNLDAKTNTPNDSMRGSEIAQSRRESMAVMRTTNDVHKTTIRIGDLDYLVDVSKIPYLASFIRQRKIAQPGSTEFVHEQINLIDVSLKGVESGYRQCFRSLPTDLSQYRSLFETYNFLGVDILCGKSLDEIIANLKSGKADYDPEERRSIPGNKSLARDTAFQLLYLILYARLGDETKDRMKLFNAVMFAVSHPGTFKHRTKRVLRDAYEGRFGLTSKQRERLDHWDKTNAVSDEPDATTEEEFDAFYDSDYSF